MVAALVVVVATRPAASLTRLSVRSSISWRQRRSNKELLSLELSASLSHFLALSADGGLGLHHGPQLLLTLMLCSHTLRVHYLSVVVKSLAGAVRLRRTELSTLHSLRHTLRDATAGALTVDRM